MKHREITGSLAERNGRYTAILNLYDEDGKRRQKSIALGIPVKGNKRKAQAQLEELKRAYSLGLPQEGKTGQESQLFADFLRDWLEITAPTIERTTYQSYRGLIAARLDPFSGRGACGCGNWSPSTSGNCTAPSSLTDVVPIPSSTTTPWCVRLSSTP